MIDWDHLRLVLAIHRHGSIQRAAAELGVDRATVLRRLDAAEADLGIRVFERRRDGCLVTAAGREVIGAGEEVERAVRELSSRVAGRDREVAGAVRVTSPEYFAAHVLAPGLARLRAAHPELTVHLATGFRVFNLVQGEAEVAVRNVRTDQQTLVSRAIGRLTYGAFASAAYLRERGAPSGTWTGHDLLVAEVAVATPGLDRLLAHASGARVAMTAGEMGPLAEAARAGAGIAYLPAIAASGLVPLDAPTGETRVFVVTHKTLARVARVRATLDFIADALRRASP